MYFRNYGLRRTWLDICVKSTVLEEPFTGNMVNGIKHCCNLNDRTIAIFSDDFEDNCVRKSLF